MGCSKLKTAVLSQNVAHRTACLALYRRLLKHSQNVTFAASESPAPAEDSSADKTTTSLRRKLKTIITKEFRKFTGRDFKVSQVREVLLVGYVAEGTLRKATQQLPDPDAVARITTFLDRYQQERPVPLRRMQATRITVQPTPKPKPAKPISPYLQDLPPKYRHKATLVAGNVMPFVRYTGTKQKISLTGLLHNRMLQRGKREERLEDLHLHLDYAIWEDEFDAQIRANATNAWRRRNPDDGMRWATVPKEAKATLQGQIFEQAVAAYNRAGKCLEHIKEHEKERKRLLNEARQKKKTSKPSQTPPKSGESGGPGMIQIPEDIVAAGQEVPEAPKRTPPLIGRKGKVTVRTKETKRTNTKRKLGSGSREDMNNLRSISQAYGGADMDVKQFLTEFLTSSK
ncbi:hypothetical protein TWF696_002346 [Orbilia brochopaga]|uniref:Mitochondrial zinc maintenance protein 1, mitochondrial n=1 Tax=Orbilia brochopaga TaxID=3140254 RepID=A0AAV9U442_9PEZI